MLSTFLSRDTYFRFNPSIEPFSIDETRCVFSYVRKYVPFMSVDDLDRDHDYDDHDGVDDNADRHQLLMFRDSILNRPEKLEELKLMAKEYASRPEVQARIKELQDVLNGEAGSGLLGVGAATSALSAVVTAASKLAAGAMDNGSVTASRRKPFS